MEAGDGALTRGPEPCPVTGCPPLASRAAALVAIDQRDSDRGPTNFNAAPEYEACQTHDLTSGKRPQRVEPRTIGLLPAGSAVAQRIIARMGGDCPAGSRRHDQSPVPALPGCAMTFFTLAEHCYPWLSQLTEIHASSQRSKYRHFSECKVQGQYSLRRE